MTISYYIKEIGRDKDGARSLSRAQATDLFGQVLDGTVTDLEVSAFCLVMRIKGETPTEMLCLGLARLVAVRQEWGCALDSPRAERPNRRVNPHRHTSGTHRASVHRNKTIRG